MKASIFLALCFVSYASASHLGGYAAPAPAIVSSGSSSQFREEDSYGNYKFGYDEAHASGKSGRREERNGGVVHGSYSLQDADGRDRTVHYVADHSGFRATIHTNEPGVDASRDPAAVLINKEGAGVASLPEPIGFDTVAVPAYRQPAPSPVFAAKGYAAPAPAPVYSDAPVDAYQAPERREAFSYSFGTTHQSAAPIYAPAPAPAYVHAAPASIAYHAVPAPIRQHGIKY